MKKAVLILSIFMFFTIVGFSQSFTLSTKNATGQGPSSNFIIDAKSQFHNISMDISDTIFEWKIITINSPTEWSFGMCDPNNCLTDLKIGGTGQFKIAIDMQGEFKGDFVPNGVGGMGSASIIISSVKHPDNFDTLNYAINAWATGVRDVNKVKDFSFYPNPVKDKFTIRFQTKEPIAIDIYNILGNKVKTLIHNGFESDFNISELKGGMYFLRFKNGNTIVSKQINIID